MTTCECSLCRAVAMRVRLRQKGLDVELDALHREVKWHDKHSYDMVEANANNQHYKDAPQDFGRA